MWNCIKKCLNRNVEESVKYHDINPDILLDLKVLAWRGGMAVVISILELECGEYYIAKRESFGQYDYIITEMCGETYELFVTEIQALMNLKKLATN